MSGPRYTLLAGWAKHARQVVGYWRERGFKDGFSTLLQLKSMKPGELKGVDQFGNQYWESAIEIPGRNRWVVFPSKALVDASSVPPEWHGWLHHMNDDTPISRPFPPRQFAIPHEPMAMSRQGVDANYLPAGHILSQRPTTFAKTGAGSADALDGAYESWHSQTNPEDARKYQPKTERR